MNTARGAGLKKVHRGGKRAISVFQTSEKQKTISSLPATTKQEGVPKSGNFIRKGIIGRRDLCKKSRCGGPKGPQDHLF